MRRLALMAVPLLAATLAGCVSTTLRAVRDPAFADAVYSALVVRAYDVYDPERRMMVEDAYVEQLRRHGFQGTVVRFYELFPPTRTADDAAVGKVLKARGLDAMLEVRVTSSGSTRSYVPRSSTTTTTGQTSQGKAGRNVDLRTTTIESGGYDVYTPWMQLEVRIVDLAKREVAWVGYTTSTGAAGGASQVLVDSQAAAVCRRLVAEGVVKSN